MSRGFSGFGIQEFACNRFDDVVKFLCCSAYALQIMFLHKLPNGDNAPCI